MAHLDNIRPATHSSSWYTHDGKRLAKQLNDFFAKASSKTEIASPLGVPGARVLIGPHAGYTYSGERLAETFQAWDLSQPIDTIFILGPSHHVAFKHSALLSQYDYYETPLGNLPINKAINTQLIGLKSPSARKSPPFKYMDKNIDDDEHSFEMHAPFIYHRLKSNYTHGQMPKLVPILISSMDDKLCHDLYVSLLPYLSDPKYHFIISSDFCHWGSRFAYTKYYAQEDSHNLISLSSYTFANLDPGHLPIYKSIEILDRKAMKIATQGDYDEWVEYISETGNTICGQKPIALVLKLIHEYKKTQNHVSSNLKKLQVFNWLGYSQSNPAKRVSDSSVSYASGYAILD